LHQRKNFCIAKVAVTRLRRQPTEWDKFFARYSSNKGFITQIYKEFTKLNSKEPTT
jgi:hypothetical protein